MDNITSPSPAILDQIIWPKRYGLATTEYVVVDVETTGLDAKTDRVVEVAAVRFKDGRPIHTFSSTVNPGCPIPAVAAGIHLLGDDEVQDAPRWPQVEAALASFIAPDDLVVAHNAPFDRSFLGVISDRTWLDTCRFARHLWPAAPRHKNMMLRFWLGLKHERLSDRSAHAAAADALVTGLLFHRELTVYQSLYPYATIDDVKAYIDSPLTVLRFTGGGMHDGKLIADIPADYLRWVLVDAAKPKGERRLKRGVDPDTLAAIHRDLALRNAVLAA
jgi:DNA polymerase III epsilon subunit-like protein